MRVIRAQSAGMCYGVKRALDLAQKAADEGLCAQTYGPLIHNPQVVHALEQQGIGVAHTAAEIDADVVLIRSHGVTPAESRAIEATGKQIIDATCPHVLRAQKAAYAMAQQGYTVVVVGERKHPEVQGLCAWAAEDAAVEIVVVSGADELPKNLSSPVGVVVQTTQSEKTLDAVVAALREQGVEFRVDNTICNATFERQQAAVLLSSQVDAMVVVGGRNSSNTTRLFEICQAYAPRAFHVETPDELEKADFKGCQVVGVSAGASTPESQIVAVEDCLRGW